jgi:hypothetical protein
MLEQGAEVRGERIRVSNLKLAPDLRQEIGVAEEKDSDFQDFRRKMLSKEESEYREGENRGLYFRDHVCVSNNEIIKKRILAEAHRSR